MAKYRCPVCGATHKTMPDKCRLCGQTMGPDAVVGDFSGSRVESSQKKGLLGIAGLVILGIVVLIGVLVVLGIAPGSRQVESVTRNIPGLPTQGNDGWSSLTDGAGGFVADFPGGERKQQSGVTLPVSSSPATKWSVNLSDDTIVFVAYAPIDTKDLAGNAVDATGTTLSPKARVRRIADRWTDTLEAQGVKVDKREETGVGGYPALYLEMRGVKDPTIPGKTFYIRALVTVREDTVYVIGTQSVYKDAAQFDKLAPTFGFIEKGSTSGSGTSVAP
ncbi:MAG: hypothetical protein U0Q07_15225 [Acidimicrobiales bacterium]